MLDDCQQRSNLSALEASLWEAFTEACVEGEDDVAEALLGLLMGARRGSAA
jgi:hypothetical protein